MRGYFWLLGGLITPIVVAWRNGSTFAFAFSLVGVGIGLYVVNVLLLWFFIRRRAPHTLADDSWEATAGTGIVPKWVSALGLISMGFVPAGLIVAALLWMRVIRNMWG